MMPVSLMSFALAMPRAPTAAMKTIIPKLTNNIIPLKRFLYGGLGVPGEDGLAVDAVRGELAEAAPLLPPFSLKMKSPNKSSRNQTKIRIQRVPSGLFFVGHDANVWIDLYVIFVVDFLIYPLTQISGYLRVWSKFASIFMTRSLQFLAGVRGLLELRLR